MLTTDMNGTGPDGKPNGQTATFTGASKAGASKAGTSNTGTSTTSPKPSKSRKKRTGAFGVPKRRKVTNLADLMRGEDDDTAPREPGAAWYPQSAFDDSGNEVPMQFDGSRDVGGIRYADDDDADEDESEVPDPDAWKAARRRALDAIRDEKNITSPRKGGLSVYGTNVLMNVVNQIGGLGTRNSQLTSFGERAEGGDFRVLQAHLAISECPADGREQLRPAPA